MRRTFLVYSFSAVLFLFAGRALAGAQQQTWTGYVTDTHCGTHCQMTSNMAPDLKCVRLCVKKGSKYGLWSGKKVYVLDPQSKSAQFAAKNVKVIGTIKGNTIHATSIEPVEAQTSSKPQTP